MNLNERPFKDYAIKQPCNMIKKETQMKHNKNNYIKHTNMFTLRNSQQH